MTDNERDELIKKYRAELDAAIASSKQQTCPSCGHCPTCGRGHYTQPYHPYPSYPYSPWSPWITYTSSTGTLTNG